MIRPILFGLVLTSAVLVAYLSAQADTSSIAASALKSSPNHSVIVARARGELQSFERFAATRGLRPETKKRRMLDMIESAKSILAEECAVHQCLGLESSLKNELATIESHVRQGQWKQAASRARAVARQYEVI